MVNFVITVMQPCLFSTIIIKKNGTNTLIKLHQNKFGFVISIQTKQDKRWTRSLIIFLRTVFLMQYLSPLRVMLTISLLPPSAFDQLWTPTSCGKLFSHRILLPFYLEPWILSCSLPRKIFSLNSLKIMYSSTEAQWYFSLLLIS